MNHQAFYPRLDSGEAFRLYRDILDQIDQTTKTVAIVAAQPSDDQLHERNQGSSKQRLIKGPKTSRSFLWVDVCLHSRVMDLHKAATDQMKKSDINPMPPNFAKYIDLVADVELEQAFDASGRQLNELDNELLKKMGDKRYAPGKWTVKDILQHLADSDRIMSYQALMLARKDELVLQGFDEKLHVKNANAVRRSIDELIKEIEIARASTVSLFESFDDELLLHKAINWKYEISVLAMGFTIIGHQTHHLRIIEERYLPLIPVN